MKTNIEKLSNPSILDNDDFIIDSHMHCFNYEHVPSGYLGIKLPNTQMFFKFLQAVTTIGGIFKNELKDTSGFMDAFNDSNPIDVFQKALSYEDPHSMHATLMMNMTHSIKGEVVHDFYRQLYDMEYINARYPNRCLPFVALDPNDPDMNSHFYHAFLKENIKLPFYGVKIYPSLGYLPSHPKLMNIFSICEENKIPIISHCSSAGVRYNRTKKVSIIGKLYNYRKDIYEDIDTSIKCGNEEWFKQTFNHPRNWIPVLEKYPNLKLDLAHFGGLSDFERYMNNDYTNNWLFDILYIIRKYNNTYSDISYNISSDKFIYLLNTLLEDNPIFRNKILWGTDFYMVLMEGDYAKIRQNALNKINTKFIKSLTNINPKRFIFNK
jgi:predicted TIM-barrel fold metal-dependent hydrolase